MKVKISTLLLIIILIVITIIGAYFLLQPKKLGEMITERNFNETTNEELKSELEEKIEKDLQEQEEEFEEKIDMYISDIYSGVDTYLSEFDNINSADEKWIWECACRYLWRDDTLPPASIVSKNDIENAAKQCFGNELQKEFPEEGIKFWLEPKENGYFLAAASVEPDFYNDYEILSYKKSDKNIIVNIVEYKYNQIFLGEPTELELYKIYSVEVVKSYSLNPSTTIDNYNEFLSNKHDEAKAFVKENVELFSTATITLEYDEQNNLLYIKSFER